MSEHALFVAALRHLLRAGWHRPHRHARQRLVIGSGLTYDHLDWGWYDGQLDHVGWVHGARGGASRLGSVAAGVDVLVALKYLPGEMSTQYRAGQRAGLAEHTTAIAAEVPADAAALLREVAA